MFFLVSLNFFLPRAMPGDPITALQAVGSPSYAEQASEATIERLRGYYGLDQPLHVQYGRYLRGLLQGDLGVSIQYNKPVTSLLADRLPWTLLLVSTAILVSAVIALLAGVHSAWRRGRGVDRGLLSLFLGPTNFPPYFIGSLALVLFAVRLRWVPLAGGSDPFSEMSPLARVADVLHHLVMPATVLALMFCTFEYLSMRASVVGELGADYLVLGRAKGLGDRRLKYRYAARNALLPVSTVVALDFAGAMAVSVLVERVFAYPGVGQLMFESVGLRDYPAMQGAFLVIAVVVVTTNLLSDVLYGRLDPRARS